MKNNDFDFIKNKFDYCENDLPAGLETKNIEEQLKSTQRHKFIEFKPKKNYKPVISAAACFIVVLGVVFAAAAGNIFGDKVTEFKDYNQINDRIEGLEKVGYPSELGAGEYYSEFYLPEEGVEEPDEIKTDGKYIYYGYNKLYGTDKNVYIFSAEGDSSEPVSVINNAVPEGMVLQGLFLYENRLVVCAESDSYTTLIKIYDVTDPLAPVLFRELEQEGEYGRAYMIEDVLYVVSDYKVTPYSGDDNVPEIQLGEERVKIDAKNIAAFDDAVVAQFAVINEIDVKEGKLLNPRAVLGGSASVYCTKEYMYINEFIKGEDYDNPERAVALAMKMSLKDHKLSYVKGDEINSYMNTSVDIGKGSTYHSVLYKTGDYIISIGRSYTGVAKDEILLFDKDLNYLDSLVPDVQYLETDKGTLAVSDDGSVFAVSALYNDDRQGVITFRIENDRLVLAEEYINEDMGNTYMGRCLMIGDTIFSFDINDNEQDNERPERFVYKFR